jgi:4'-phosphopantetheinyl transferase EntD
MHPLLDGLFPDCARLVIAPDAQTIDESTLPFEEADAIKAAVPSRRREFALGRWCAREALAALGVSPQPIPVGFQRRPIWPAGVVGSITHCTGFVAAVVAPSTELRAIGFDAELAIPLDADLVSMICTAQDVAWIQRAPQPPASGWPKLFFSAKESVHKCISPLFGRTLDFLDVRLHVDSPGSTFTVESANAAETSGIDLGALEGRFAIADGRVFTSVIVRA